MSTVHASGLASLEDEFVGRAALFRVGAYFLVWEVERHDGNGTLIRGFEFVKMSRRKYIPKQLVRRTVAKGEENLPAGCVALEVLALALQQACTDFLSRQMVLTRVVDLLWSSERHGRVHDSVLVGDEVNPFLVLGHGNGTFAKVANNVEVVLSLALQDTSIGVVSLLDLANHDGLEFAARAFEVEICLRQLVTCGHRATTATEKAKGSRVKTYLVEIVLLINLALNLTVDSQSQEERILLASGGSLIDFALVENISESGDGLAGVVHLLVYRVLEVTGEVLDLLDLLLQITAQTGEGEDDVLLNLTSLVRLLHSLFVIVTEQLESVIDSGRLEEA